MRAKWAIGLAAACLAGALLAQGAHKDRQLLPKGCASCHENHGGDGVLLNESGEKFCLQCHGGAERQRKAKEAKRLGAEAKELPDIEAEFLKPFAHPVTETWPAKECLACHAVHPKPKDNRFVSHQEEQSRPFGTNELCLGCHEELTTATAEGGLPASPHISAAAGAPVRCTDCHGNDDAGGPRGLHGSRYAGILRDAYATQDGAAESAETYALCYRCHERKSVLSDAGRGHHVLHVMRRGVSCHTCHDPHASAAPNLIRFDGGMVFPMDGVVEYSPASGCTLVCHGVPHSSAPLLPVQALPVKTKSGAPKYRRQNR
jgi:predicted CXXCH cytochrome family protein